MNSVRKSVVISSISSIVSRLMSFLLVVTVARLLTPEEIGVYVVAASFMMLTSQLSALGTNNYLIREQQLTLEKQQSCLALSIMISWSIGGIIVVASPLISDFYDLKALTTLILILSIPYFLNPFTSLTTALLSKAFQFERYMIIEIAGTFTSLVTTVAFIYLDYGVYSMAIGEASSATVKLLLAFLLRPEETSWKPKIFELKPILSVGIFTSFINLLARMEYSISDLILGRVSTTTTVAITSRAIGLHVFIKEILGNGIGQIATPYLSVNAKDKLELKNSFLSGNNLAAAFIAPPLAVAAVLAEPLIYLFFGDQWKSATSTAQILGLWIVLRVLVIFSQQVLIVARKEKALLLSKVMTMLFLGFAIFLASSVYSINVAFAFVAFSILDLAASLILLKISIDLTVFEFFKSMLKTIALIAICVVFSVSLSQIHHFLENPILIVIAHGSAMIPVWLFGLKLLRHPLWYQLSSLPILNKFVH